MLEAHTSYLLGHTECSVGRTYGHQNKVDLLKAEKLLSQDLFALWFNNSVQKKTTGAPYDLDAYSVSNSHSKGWVCVARCSSHEIGIDIQQLSKKCERVKHKFISDLDVIKPSHLSDLEYYTLIWSLKEAAYKWFEEYIALKDIVITSLDKSKAEIYLHSDVGTLNCQAHFIITKDWALSVVEK
jgi:phosphopantetheinyl transferase